MRPLCAYVCPKSQNTTSTCNRLSTPAKPRMCFALTSEQGAFQWRVCSAGAKSSNFWRRWGQSVYHPAILPCLEGDRAGKEDKIRNPCLIHWWFLHSSSWCFSGTHSWASIVFLAKLSGPLCPCMNAKFWRKMNMARSSAKNALYLPWHPSPPPPRICRKFEGVYSKCCTSGLDLALSTCRQYSVISLWQSEQALSSLSLQQPLKDLFCSLSFALPESSSVLARPCCNEQCVWSKIGKAQGWGINCPSNECQKCILDAH